MIARLKSSFSEMLEDLYLRGLIQSSIVKHVAKRTKQQNTF